MPQNTNEYSCDDDKPCESITPVQCDEIVSYHFTENFSVEFHSERI